MLPLTLSPSTVDLFAINVGPDLFHIYFDRNLMFDPLCFDGEDTVGFA